MAEISQIYAEGEGLCDLKDAWLRTRIVLDFLALPENEVLYIGDPTPPIEII